MRRRASRVEVGGRRSRRWWGRAKGSSGERWRGGGCEGVKVDQRIARIARRAPRDRRERVEGLLTSLRLVARLLRRRDRLVLATRLLPLCRGQEGETDRQRRSSAGVGRTAHPHRAEELLARLTAQRPHVEAERGDAPSFELNPRPLRLTAASAGRGARADGAAGERRRTRATRSALRGRRVQRAGAHQSQLPCGRPAFCASQ